MRRNITLEDAERATKVRLAFLDALETERWEDLPPRAYTQGLLRLYARYLGLDPERAVLLLPPEEGDEEPQPVIAARGPDLPVGIIVLALVVLVVAVTGVCAWRSVSGAGKEPPAAAVQEPATTPTGTATRVPIAATVIPEASPNAGGGGSAAAGTATATPTPGATGSATPAGSPTTTATPAGPTPTTTPVPTGTPAPKEVEVPALVGMTWQQAVEVLRQLELTPTRQEQAADNVPQEQVLAQNPPAGTKLTNERGVALTVSVGKPGVEVPNVVGRTEAEARAILTAANLPPSRYANYQGRADLPDALLRSVCVGCVLSMTPGAGTLAPPGTSIYLAVRRE